MTVKSGFQGAPELQQSTAVPSVRSRQHVQNSEVMESAGATSMTSMKNKSVNLQGSGVTFREPESNYILSNSNDNYNHVTTETIQKLGKFIQSV